MRMRHRHHRHGHAGCGGQIVLEVDDQLIARIQVQRGSLKTGVGHVAIARQALRIHDGLELECDFQQSVLTAQVWRRRQHRSGGEPLTHLIRRVRHLCMRSTGKCHQTQGKTADEQQPHPLPGKACG